MQKNKFNLIKAIRELVDSKATEKEVWSFIMSMKEKHQLTIEEIKADINTLLLEYQAKIN